MTNHEKHIMMWDELARTGDGRKESTEAYNLYPVGAACYACVESEGDCEFCPIIWTRHKNKDMSCHRSRSSYSRWIDAKDVKTHKKYAAIIRDLPWRKP